ncbi:MAG: NADH-quinone oxidoreductase subunit C [Chloroflexota bacterium]|nr:NADH-quinone oxidoreductase subunit C [Chloroflexota bacterium]
MTNAGGPEEGSASQRPPDEQTTADAAATPGDPGVKREQSTGEIPDAATVPSIDPAAADAPQVVKPSDEKVAADAPPSQTGTPPAEQSADAPAAEGTSPAPGPAADRPARPAREAEPKEAPRVAPPAGSLNEVLASAAPGIEMKAYMVPSVVGQSVAVEVSRDDLPAVMAAARDDERLDMKYMRCLSGVDWQEQLEVVYHLWSFTKRHALTVKTRVSYDDASVPSITSLYPSADWHEREARDMFGINFEGHPNLVPLLLPEDMTDHFPLRKDNPLQEIEEWQGENLRDGAGEGDE